MGRRDVDRDGRVTPLDVLLLVNFLNRRTTEQAGLGADVFPPPSYDVNDDQAVTPLDALSVINDLNGVPTLAGEGETDEAARRRPSGVVLAAWLVESESPTRRRERQRG